MSFVLEMIELQVVSLVGHSDLLFKLHEIK